jgi:hypothetical protein
MRRDALAEIPRLLAAIPDEAPPALRTRLWTYSVRDPAPPDFASGAAFGEYIRQALRGNIPAFYGVAAFPGHSPVASRALRRLVDREAGPALLGIEYLIIETSKIPPGQPGIVATDPTTGASIVRLPAARPKAFVAHRWYRVPDPLALVTSGAVDPLAVVLTGLGDAPSALAADAPAGPCEATSSRPEAVDLLCTTPYGGYATLLAASAPGWTATVNGVPTLIETADTVFRAVRIGPGVHRIAFRYETPWLRTGALIALVAWGALAAVVITASRKTHPETRVVAAARSPGGRRGGDNVSA